MRRELRVFYWPKAVNRKSPSGLCFFIIGFANNVAYRLKRNSSNELYLFIISRADETVRKILCVKISAFL